MLLSDNYADKIYGTITCYGRMIIHGYILNETLPKVCRLSESYQHPYF